MVFVLISIFIDIFFIYTLYYSTINTNQFTLNFVFIVLFDIFFHFPHFPFSKTFAIFFI